MSRSDPIYFGIIVIVFLLFFGKALNYGWVLEDKELVKNNVYLMSAGGLKIIFRGNFVRSPFMWMSQSYYRPLSAVANFVNYKIGGNSPASFRVGNYIIFLAAVFVLFIILTLLTTKIIALLLTLIFVLHPLNVESIVWISNKPDLLYFFFIICSVYFFIFKRNYIVAFIFYFFALFSKEGTILIPLSFLLFESLDEQRRQKALLHFLPYVLLMLFRALAAKFLFPDSTSMMKNFINPFLFKTMWLKQFSYTFYYYLKLLVLPFRLSIHYSLDNITAISVFQFFISLIILLFFIVGLSFLGYKRKKYAAFGLAFYLLALIPVLHIFKMAYLLMVHNMLIPMIGLIISLAALLKESKATLIILCCALVYFTIVTGFTIPHWKDEKTMLDYSLTIEPNSKFLLSARAANYIANNNFDSALQIYEKIGFNKLTLTDNMNLGYIFYHKRKMLKAKEYLEKMFYTKKVIYPMHIFILGLVYNNLNESDSASAAFKKYSDLVGERALFLIKQRSIDIFQRGRRAYEKGNYREALNYFLEVADYPIPDEEKVPAYLWILRCYTALNQYQKSFDYYFTHIRNIKIVDKHRRDEVRQNLINYLNYYYSKTGDRRALREIRWQEGTK